MVSGYNH